MSVPEDLFTALPPGGGDEADPYCYSTENVLRQVERASPRLGFYEVCFYAVGPRPSREKTDRLETFYYYPSGGTLRDRNMNIVYYEPRLDRYRATRKSDDQDGMPGDVA